MQAKPCNATAYWRWLALALLCWLPLAHGDGNNRPQIILILDDMGNSAELGERALALPGPLHLAFLPHRPNTVALAERSHALGNEVIVHAPMESARGHNPGSAKLHQHMNQAQLHYTLGVAINAVPHARGVNNHMGSLLTTLPQPMDWVMQVLKQHQLYFIDSRTSRDTVAEQRAAAVQIPHLHRDVFLDNDRRPAAIRRQFEQLLQTAQRNGLAVGIGHPYPETLDFLQQALPALPLRGYQLVRASEVLQAQTDCPAGTDKLLPNWQNPPSGCQQALETAWLQPQKR